MVFDFSKIQNILKLSTNQSVANLGNGSDFLALLGNYAGIDNVFDPQEAAKFINNTGLQLGSLLNGTGYTIANSTTTSQTANGSNDFEDVGTTILTGKKLEDLKSLAEKNKDSKFWQDLQKEGLEKVFDKLDKDGDGTLSEDEVKNLSKLDGEDKSISSKDLENFFKNPVEALKDTATNLANAAGNAVSAAGKAAGQKVNSAFNNVSSKLQELQGKSLEEQISDAETKKQTEQDNISKAQEEANLVTQQQEAAKNEAVQAIKAQNQQQADAQKAYADAQVTVTQVRTAITGLESVISKDEASKATAESDLAGLEEQSKTMETMSGATDDQKTKLKDKQGDVKGQIEAKKAEIARLQAEIDAKNAELASKKTELTNAEGNRDKALSTLESLLDPTQKAALDEKLKAANDQIDQATKTSETTKTNSQKNIDQYNAQITQLKQAQGTVEAYKAGSTETGLKLIDAIENWIKTHPGSENWCLGAVNDAMAEVMGQRAYSTNNCASGSIDWFLNNKNFKRVECPFNKAPLGSVVITEATGSARAGHACVVVGYDNNGNAIMHSDNNSSWTLAQLGNPKYYIFVPIDQNNVA